jgi:dipeptidyl-peptidase-4
MRLYGETRGFNLGRPVGIKPSPDGKTVLFLRSPPREPTLGLYEFDVSTGHTRELVTPAQVLKGAEEVVSTAERARRERMRITVGGFTSFDLSHDGKVILLPLGGKLYVFKRDDGAVTELPLPNGTVLDARFSPDGRSVSYVRNSDLCVMDLKLLKERRLTTGATEALTRGLAEFAAQEEMDRMRGYWWSPDSQFILYEEADTHNVEEFFIADPMHPEHNPVAFRYPRAGRANAAVRLGVVGVRDGKITWLTWDAANYPYVANVTWEGNAPISVVVQDRAQRQQLLLAADAKTGKTQVLVREMDAAWINIDSHMPAWQENGSGFLWTTERNGAWELELRSRDGALLRTLVDSRRGMQEFIHLDSQRAEAWILAGWQPEHAQLMRVALDGTSVAPRSSATGRRKIVFAKDASIFVETLSSAEDWRRADVRSVDGQLLGTLPAVNLEPPMRPQVEWTVVGDGAGLHTAVVRPRSFSSEKKYPVILSVYGGPHHNMVTAALEPYLREQWIADHGFVVVMVDGRGTPRRGRAWERSIVGDFSSLPLQDQVAGLKWLGQRFPEMDLGRVGVMGWSFGGYMAALAVMRRPDVFQTAVAGAPVVDWRDYDTHYTERYLGLPDVNTKGYQNSNLLTHASTLSRPLLLIHGTADDNVYFFHSLKLSDALFRAGRAHSFLPLAGLTHQVPNPAVVEALWEALVTHLSATLHPDAAEQNRTAP